jgi:type I restriction enzyme S subunit
LAEKFDTLVSVRAPVGAQNMASGKCCLGRGVAAFRYNADSTFYTYTYYKLMSLMDNIKSFNDEGTVFGSIGKHDFESMRISIPPYTLITKYENSCKSINDKIIKNCQQINKLESILSILLPRLISGDVRMMLDD